MSTIPIIDLSDEPAAEPAAKRPGRPRGARNRAPLRRVKADASRVGVKATVAAGPRAEPARQEEGTVEEITRSSLSDRQRNMFDVPAHRKKAGWDYKWEVIGIYGAPVDPSVLLDAEEAGWRPCYAKDWPELVPKGTPTTSTVERYGQRLYTRPMALSLQAMEETFKMAKQQEYDRMRSASEGRPKDHQGLREIPGIKIGNPSLDIQIEHGQR